MKTQIVLITEEHRQRALFILESVPLGPVHELRICEHKKDRSAAQNSLLWKWNTVIGIELGQLKDEVHEHYKDKFLVSIYERDDPDYAAMIQALRDVWKAGMKNEAVNLRKQIVALTSTTKASVKQFAEFLTDIEHDAAALAIRLPHPKDIYFDAMGEKRP